MAYVLASRENSSIPTICGNLSTATHGEKCICWLSREGFSIANISKSTTKNLPSATKMISFMHSLPRVAVDKSQWMVRMDKFPPSVERRKDLALNYNFDAWNYNLISHLLIDDQKSM